MAVGAPIETVRLSKTYDKSVSALIDLDLRVERGDVLVLGAGALLVGRRDLQTP